jgi:hypothetical protein
MHKRAAERNQRCCGPNLIGGAQRGTFMKRCALEMHTISAADCVQNAGHIL